MADIAKMPTLVFLLLNFVLNLISIHATELTATTATVAATKATATAELKAVVFQGGSAGATSSIRFKAGAETGGDRRSKNFLGTPQPHGASGGLKQRILIYQF